MKKKKNNIEKEKQEIFEKYTLLEERFEEDIKNNEKNIQNMILEISRLNDEKSTLVEILEEKENQIERIGKTCEQLNHRVEIILEDNDKLRIEIDKFRMKEKIYFESNNENQEQIIDLNNNILALRNELDDEKNKFWVEKNKLLLKNEDLFHKIDKFNAENKNFSIEKDKLIEKIHNMENYKKETINNKQELLQKIEEKNYCIEKLQKEIHQFKENNERNKEEYERILVNY